MPARLILLLATGLAILAGIGVWAVHERDGYDVIHLRVPTSRDLKVGAAVVYLGIQVGSVSRIGFTEDSRGMSAAAVEIRLERPYAPLRAEDRVAVTRSGLLDDMIISIVPGPATARQLVSGDTLVTNSLSDETRQVLDALTNDLARQANDSAKPRTRGRSRPPHSGE
jgi:ABC-type transporter Mla subunit MlaD